MAGDTFVMDRIELKNKHVVHKARTPWHSIAENYELIISFVLRILPVYLISLLWWLISNALWLLVMPISKLWMGKKTLSSALVWFLLTIDGFWLAVLHSQSDWLDSYEKFGVGKMISRIFRAFLDSQTLIRLFSARRSNIILKTSTAEHTRKSCCGMRGRRSSIFVS